MTIYWWDSAKNGFTCYIPHSTSISYYINLHDTVGKLAPDFSWKAISCNLVSSAIVATTLHPDFMLTRILSKFYMHSITMSGRDDRQVNEPRREQLIVVDTLSEKFVCVYIYSLSHESRDFSDKKWYGSRVIEVTTAVLVSIESSGIVECSWHKN